MRVAATYENGEIFQHFGRCPGFKIYEVEDGKIVSSEIISSGNASHEGLAVFLSAQGVETVVCGGLGSGMTNALHTLGITIYAGNTGDADEAVARLAAGTLPQHDSANCNH